MAYVLICDNCRETLYPCVAYVVLPTRPPSLSGGTDYHYHPECWEEMQRKAENSNPSPLPDQRA